MLASLMTMLIIQPWFGSITIRSYICQQPDIPTITSPSEGLVVTSGSILAIKGYSTADTTVTLTDNDQVYAIITADQDNSFATQFLINTTGTHQLGISSYNPCGNGVGSNVVIKAVDPETPVNPAPTITGGLIQIPESVILNKDGDNFPTATMTLDIVSPLNDATTYATSIYLFGNTNKNTTIEIQANEKVVASLKRPDTSFGVSIPLSLGVNNLLVIATSDTEGQQTDQAILKITRIASDKVTSSSTTGAEQTQTNNKAWYQTTPGKIIVVSVGILTLIAILALLLL